MIEKLTGKARQDPGLEKIREQAFTSGCSLGSEQVQLIGEEFYQYREPAKTGRMGCISNCPPTLTITTKSKGI